MSLISTLLLQQLDLNEAYARASEGVRAPDAREPYHHRQFEWALDDIDDETARRETRWVPLSLLYHR